MTVCRNDASWNHVKIPYDGFLRADIRYLSGVDGARHNCPSRKIWFSKLAAARHPISQCCRFDRIGLGYQYLLGGLASPMLRLLAALQSARTSAGVFAVAPRHRAVYEGEVVSVGILQVTRTTSGQVVNHVGAQQPQPIEIDDVQVRALTRLKYATISESEQARRAVRLLFDQGLDGNFGPRCLSRAQCVRR